MVRKVTFVGEGFTRKPPKYERFIRPMALRYKKAHVTHPELKATFYLDILGVKKNPQSPLYTSLGVITKGTILEVNVSDLGLVTPSGKVVWGKYAQVCYFAYIRYLLQDTNVAFLSCSRLQTIQKTMAVSMQSCWCKKSSFSGTTQ